MLNVNANIIQAKRNSLPLPVLYNPELYLSRTNGKFDKSEVEEDDKIVKYVNKWINPYSGKEATQDTGDYRSKLVSDGVRFDGTNDHIIHDTLTFDDAEEYTICVWVKWDGSALPNFIIPIGEYPNSDNSIYFYNSNNKRFTYRNTTDTFVIGTYATNIFDGNYHCVCWRIKSDRNIEVIFDNNEKINADVSNTKFKYNALGVGYNSLSWTWSGLFDEYTIYRKYLTDNQLTNFYNYTKNLKGI